LEISNLINPVHEYAASGMYDVSFVPNDNVCIMPWDSTINVQDVILEVSLQQDALVCNDSPLTIQVSGNGLVYEWSAFPTFNPLLATGPSLAVAPVKNGVYYVRTTNSVGCVAVDSININNASVDLQLNPADNDICAGNETEISVTNLDLQDVLTYQWSPALPNIPNPVVAPTQETTYHVVVTNQFGCTNELDFLVKVTTVAVTATVTGKETICPGMSTTLLATPTGNGSILGYQWDPAAGLSDETISDPTATPTSDQSYTVTVTTTNGCTATDEVFIQVISGQCVEPYIFVPKAFTPNNDANNDFFVVRGVNITELHFIVWNRWGEKVYETTDPTAPGWDGTYQGRELTPDSYAWYLRATCGNGAIYENKGDVTLLK
jgi:gliding motility-associated-like protein